MSFTGTDETSRQVIDIAVGILIGLRGCARTEAFDELVRVVHKTGLGLGAVASGLVAVASGSSSADHAEAFSAWGELIRSSRAASLATAS
ncbi:ANTAR domain-containing protein [Mycolicibacterium iranicum]|uniref:Histidine kinase n=1 Tax=Mycolicibacterium iranicum TaxID=912594 RepID=A0A178LW44_MYCIR|nr:ANTAR domain-containing protein [Mycolicibacterium iranicum]OAN37819.1 histidine kinase [Mycolicibacterium iranicum]